MHILLFNVIRHKLAGRLESRGRGRLGREHDCHLVDTLVGGERLDARDRLQTRLVNLLEDLEVSRGTSRNLREMGDGDDLKMRSHGMEDIAHADRDVARDTGVDLVEDDGREQRLLSDERLDGKHQAREFATRSYLGEFAQLPSPIGIEEERDDVATERSELLGRRYHYRETSLLHAQLGESGKELLLDILGREAAYCGEFLGFVLDSGIGLVHLFHGLAHLGVHPFRRLNILLEPLLDGKELGDRLDRVLLLKAVDEVKTGVDEFLAVGREIEVRVDGRERSEDVAQLDDVGLEARV